METALTVVNGVAIILMIIYILLLNDDLKKNEQATREIRAKIKAMEDFVERMRREN